MRVSEGCKGLGVSRGAWSLSRGAWGGEIGKRRYYRTLRWEKERKKEEEEEEERVCVREYESE
jgi:hypothetical protein